MSKNQTKPTGRKRQIVASVTALAIVGSGVAYAAYLAQMNMKGNIGAGQFTALYVEDSYLSGKVGNVFATATSTTSLGKLSGADKDATYTGSDAAFKTLDLGATTLFPDETYIVEVQPVANTKSGRSGYVSGVSGTIGTGWEAKIVAGCGADVTATRGQKVRLQIKNVNATTDLDASSLKITVAAMGNGETKPVPVTCTSVPAA